MKLYIQSRYHENNKGPDTNVAGCHSQLTGITTPKIRSVLF
jgi:hypothetical protein